MKYGINVKTNEPVNIELRALQNNNAALIGAPGTGLAFAVNKERIHITANPKNRIIVIDDIGEDCLRYKNEANACVIDFEPTSRIRINPLDLCILNMEDSYLNVNKKEQFIVGFLSLIVERDFEEPV